MSRQTRQGAEVTRRVVVAGTGLLAASAALAACAGYGNQGAAPRSEGTPADSGGPAQGAPPGEGLAGASDSPVGGGAVFEDEEVVVTQPAAGTFKAFSASCTHQGCTVNKVANGTIDCPGHGSKFAIE